MSETNKTLKQKSWEGHWSDLSHSEASGSDDRSTVACWLLPVQPAFSTSLLVSLQPPPSFTSRHVRGLHLNMTSLLPLPSHPCGGVTYPVSFWPVYWTGKNPRWSFSPKHTLATAMAFTSWAAIPPLFSFKYFLHKLQKGLLKPPDISPTELKLTVDEGRCQMFQNNTDFHWCDWVFCPTNLFQYTLYSESQGSDSY